MSDNSAQGYLSYFWQNEKFLSLHERHQSFCVGLIEPRFIPSISGEFFTVTLRILGSTGGGEEGPGVFPTGLLVGPFGCSDLSDMENSNENNISNIIQIKEYVEFHHKNVSENLDKLDTRLIGVIAFSGILLQFIDTLETVGTLSQLLKIGSSILFIISIGCCLRGVFPGNIGGEDPRILRESEEWFNYDSSDPQRIERKISDDIMETAEEIRAVAQQKSDCLAGAIWCLAIGSSFIGINTVIKALVEQSLT